MKSKFIKFAMLSSIASTLVACSSSNDGSNEGGSGSGSPYIGEWATGCVVSQLEQVSDSFFTYRLSVDASGWVYTQSGYFDEGCTLQSQGTAETGVSERGTITMAATYVDAGSVTTSEGILAYSLNSTVTSFDNSLEEAEGTANSVVGSSVEFLTHVNESDVLYVDRALLGLSDEPGSLLLTLPFYKAQ